MCNCIFLCTVIIIWQINHISSNERLGSSFMSSFADNWNAYKYLCLTWKLIWRRTIIMSSMHCVRIQKNTDLKKLRIWTVVPTHFHLPWKIGIIKLLLYLLFCALFTGEGLCRQISINFTLFYLLTS